MKTSYTKEEVEYLKTHYSNLGAEKCAAILDKTPMQIRCKAQKIGIKLSFSTRSSIVKKWKTNKIKPFEEYSVNPDIFINIKNKESAYMLGFLWADGYVSKNSRHTTIGLGIKREDFDPYILPVLNKLGRWNVKYVPHKHGGKEQGRARISNRPLADYLEKHGYRSKSNTACSILSTIQPDFKRYWFRGFFDGDGCVYIGKSQYRVAITGPINQNWKFVENLYNDLNVRYSILRKTSKSGSASNIIITNKKDMITFLNYIYDGYDLDNIGYKRKYEKFIQLKNGYKHPTSEFIGLSKTKCNTWQCKVCFNKKIYYVGTFKTEDEASKAYNIKLYELQTNKT